MEEKRKDLLLYILLAVGVVVVITTYILVYYAHINSDYLYFEKRNLDVNLGKSYTLEELGLNTNIDRAKLVVFYNENEIIEEDICFNRAGDVHIVVQANNLKASIYVKVVFNNIDEYFDIFANVGNDKILLSADSCIEMYLPSGDREIAESEGYVNSFSININYLQCEEDFQIVYGSNLTLFEGKLYATKLGVGKVYFIFDNFGKSFEFSVLVKAIPVVNITSNYLHDILYVGVGERFDLDINIFPTYATTKEISYSISDSCIIFDGVKFVATKIGDTFITISSGVATFVLQVVVCDIPDKMVVSVLDEFSYGNKCNAVVNFYKDDTLIDNDFYLECYIDGVKVDNNICFDGFVIKHNTFSLNIVCEDKFIIKIISLKNSSLTFDISVNN